MKFTAFALALVVACQRQQHVSGFSPSASSTLAATTTRSTTTTTTTSLASAVSAPPPPPQREAPGAGYVPEWEDRPGLSPEEFMESDMTKPDASGMWECPLTLWNSDE